MSVYEKLANIQKYLFVPKGQKNDFGNYKYRSCEDILKTVKPLCESEKCVLFITNTLECIGSRNYVKATVRLVDLETGEDIEVTAHAREEETKKGMDGSQITGASSSYARKYALAGMFSIDNEKDSDATNDHKEMMQKSEQGKVLEEAQMKIEVMKLLNNATKEYIEGVCNHYHVNRPNDMTLEQCKDFIENLNKQKEKKSNE